MEPKLSVTEQRISEDDFETIIVEVNEHISIIRTIATIHAPKYAYVFAAAPTLLKALIECRKAMNFHGIVGDSAQFMADDAIALAESGVMGGTVSAVEVKS